MAVTRKKVLGQERDEMRTKVLAQYVDEGMSIRQIAGEMGCSYGLVRNLLKETGVQMRSRGGLPGSGT